MVLLLARGGDVGQPQGPRIHSVSNLGKEGNKFWIGKFHSWMQSQTERLLQDLNSGFRQTIKVGRTNRNKMPSQVTDLDISKEKRTQKFLLLILISHFICIVPINILKYV